MTASLVFDRTFGSVFAATFGPQSGNPLSISAPSALLFLDASQPISLYDFEAHNFIIQSEDFTQSPWFETGVVDADTLEDTSAVAFEYVLEALPDRIVKGRQYEVYARVAQDAVTSADRFLAISYYCGGQYNYAVFDTSAADTNFGQASDRTQADSITVTDVGPGTHWDIKIVFTAVATGYTEYGLFAAWGTGIADLTIPKTVAQYSDVTAQTTAGTVNVVRSQFRDYSSPDTYTSTTTAASEPVASYGDIQFADSEDVGGDYTVTLTVTEGGTLSLGDPASGITFTPVTGGDGTLDAFMEFTGTIAEINAALLASSPTTLQGLVNEAATITVTLTRNADDAAASPRVVNLRSATVFSSITLTEQTDDYIYQRTKDTTARTITISGTYVDGYPSLTAVEAAIKRRSDDSIVTNWTTVDASIAGGTWSGDISVPQGGAYYVDVRDTVQTTVGDTDANDFFVGIWAIVYGQSNALEHGTIGTPPTPSVGTGWWNGAAFSTTMGGIGIGTLANEIVARTGLPCAILHHGVNGAAIDDLIEGQANYNDLIAKLNAADGDAEVTIWIQGVSNVTTLQATYIGHMNDLHASLASEVGRTRAQMPLIISGLGHDASEVGNDNDWGTFRETELAAAAQHADIYYSHTGIDFPDSGGVHYAPTGHELLAERTAFTYAYTQGDEVSEAAFFLDTEAHYVDDTHTRISVVHGPGDDFSFAGASTGFELYNGSSWISATGAREDADNILLTHAASQINDREVGFMRGMNPVITGKVIDNSDISAALVPNHSGIAIADPPSLLVSHTLPGNNETNVVASITLEIIFTRNIQFGTGNITVRDNDGGWANLEVFDVESDTGGGAGTVSISGKKLSIELTADMASEIAHAVRIDATAIEDLSGNGFAGIADDTTFSFTTAASSSLTVIARDVIKTASIGGTSIDTQTFDIGTATATRLVVVCFRVQSTMSAEPTVTVNGVTLSTVVAGNGGVGGIHAGVVSSGDGNQTVVVDYSADGHNFQQANMSLFVIDGLTSNTVKATSSGTRTISVDDGDVLITASESTGSVYAEFGAENTEAAVSEFHSTVNHTMSSGHFLPTATATFTIDWQLSSDTTNLNGRHATWA